MTLVRLVTVRKGRLDRCVPGITNPGAGKGRRGGTGVGSIKQVIKRTQSCTEDPQSFTEVGFIGASR